MEGKAERGLSIEDALSIADEISRYQDCKFMVQLKDDVPQMSGNT